MRVLHITSELDGGGVERILHDYFTRMTPEIVSDFAITSQHVGILEKPLRDSGAQIFRIPPYRDGVLTRIARIRNIIDVNGYQVVHDHSGYKAFASLYAAWRSGVPCRIAHSHQAHVPESPIGSMVRRLVTPLTRQFATHLYACGGEAGEWMWGRAAISAGRVHIMTNAIDWTRFRYSEAKRSQLRASLGIEERFVVGNVARFSEQKNHQHLVRSFEALSRTRDDAVLLLVGGGELLESTRSLVSELGLDDRVLFCGVRDDVPDLLSAMDIFVLPSLFEGLPVVLLEVQANGLPIVVSDVVTPESLLLDNYQRLSLAAPPEEWAKAISSGDGERETSPDRIRERCDIVGYAKLEARRYREQVPGQ